MTCAVRTMFVLVAAALAAGCSQAGPGPADASFGHGSPRSECRTTVDEARVPYALPQVVAAGWGAPVKLAATLNTACPEDAIEISGDGTTLWFFGSPEVGAGADELLNGTTGTYVAHRVGTDPAAFAEPRFFDLRKGAPGGACDGELSFTPAGDVVFFHSTRAANTGYRQTPAVDDPLDIYFAPVAGGEPGPAQNLAAVNSAALDGEHALSPDGTRLYLTSTRPGGLGQTDLYVSEESGGGWSAPVNLGAPVNTAQGELQPAFAAGDPETMYFVSDRGGPTGIWRTRWDGAAWGEPELQVTGYVGEPSLVADGSLLYFVHVLVDDQGVFGSDVWYVARTP